MNFEYKQSMNKKVKICFIINNLSQGGAERQFLELVKNIDKSIFETHVCIYAIKQELFYSEIENIEGIILYKKTLKNSLLIFKIIESIVFLHEYLKNSNFDIIHTTLFMNGVVVRLAAPKRKSIYIVTTIRNSLASYPKIHLLLEQLLIPKSYVVANTKCSASQFSLKIKPKYKHQVFHIYNGFDSKRFRPQTINQSTLTIGNAGRMTRQKNQIQLLRVFNSINISNIKLKIVGDEGEQTSILNKYITYSMKGKKVELLDKVSDIENFYQSISIFILSSLWEGCPNVIFEAMLSNCLCIISRHADIDGFVSHNINGLVYDGSDEDLKEKLEYAISIIGTTKYISIQQQGYMYALNNFSMQSMVNAYETLYLNIFNNKPDEISDSKNVPLIS